MRTRIHFDDFSDEVEEHVARGNNWTDVQVANFISPRARKLIQLYRDGDSVADAATKLLRTKPAKIHLD